MFVQRYTHTAIVLHWIVALLILVNVGLGLSADYWSDTWIRLVIDTHKSIGITLLGLVLLRILWRAGHKPPPFPDHYHGWEKAAAHAVHAGLYIVILGLPLSGWLHDSAWNGAATHPFYLFGAVSFPRIGVIENLDPAVKETLHSVFGAAHVWFGYVLYGLLALHLGAVLKHQLIDKEAELQRMLP